MIARMAHEEMTMIIAAVLIALGFGVALMAGGALFNAD